MANEDKLKQMWDHISQRYDDWDSYEQFKTDMDDDKVRGSMFKAFSKDFNNWKTQDDFDSFFGYTKPTPNSSAVPQDKQTSSDADYSIPADKADSILNAPTQNVSGEVNPNLAESNKKGNLHGNELRPTDVPNKLAYNRTPKEEAIYSPYSNINSKTGPEYKYEDNAEYWQKRKATDELIYAASNGDPVALNMWDKEITRANNKYHEPVEDTPQTKPTESTKPTTAKPIENNPFTLNINSEDIKKNNPLFNNGLGAELNQVEKAIDNTNKTIGTFMQDNNVYDNFEKSMQANLGQAEEEKQKKYEGSAIKSAMYETFKENGGVSKQEHQVMMNPVKAAEDAYDAIDKNALSNYVYSLLGVDASQKSGVAAQVSPEDEEKLSRMFNTTATYVAQSITQNLYNKFASDNKPSLAEYMLDRSFRESLTGKIANLLLNGAKNDSELMQQVMAIVNSSTTDWDNNPYIQGAIGAGSMIVDSGLFAVGGAGSSVVGQQVGKFTNKFVGTALGQIASGGRAAGASAYRWASMNPVTSFVTNLETKIATSAVSSGMTFGAYDLMSEGVTQLETQKFDLSNLLSSYGSGFVKGAELGVIGGTSSAITENMGIIGKVIGGVGGFGATGALFTYDEMKELVANGQAEWDNVSDWTKVAGKQGVMLGLLKVKELPEIISRYKNASSNGQETISKSDIADINSFTNLNVGGVNDLLKTLVDNPTAYKDIIESDNIPLTVKQKIQYVANGRLSPFGTTFDKDGKAVKTVDAMSATYDAKIEQDENGMFNLVTYNEKGELVSRIRCKDKKDADKKLADISPIIEHNTINGLVGLSGVHADENGNIIDDTSARETIVNNAIEIVNSRIGEAGKKRGYNLKDALAKDRDKRDETEQAMVGDFITELQNGILKHYRGFSMSFDNENVTKAIESADATGNVVAGLLGDKPVTIKGNESEGASVIATDKDGNQEMVDKNNVQVTDVAPVESVAQAVSETYDPAIGAKVGNVIYVPDGKGNWMQTPIINTVGDQFVFSYNGQNTWVSNEQIAEWQTQAEQDIQKEEELQAAKDYAQQKTDAENELPAKGQVYELNGVRGEVVDDYDSTDGTVRMQFEGESSPRYVSIEELDNAQRIDVVAEQKAKEEEQARIKAEQEAKQRANDAEVARIKKEKEEADKLAQAQAEQEAYEQKLAEDAAKRENQRIAPRLAEVRKSDNVNEDKPFDALEAAAWAVVRGFKADGESIKKYTGLKSLFKEGLGSFQKKGGMSLDQVAHVAWETMGSPEDVDPGTIRDEIVNFLLSGGRKAALDHLEKKAGISKPNEQESPMFEYEQKKADDEKLQRENAERDLQNEIQDSNLEDLDKNLSREEENAIFAEEADKTNSKPVEKKEIKPIDKTKEFNDFTRDVTSEMPDTYYFDELHDWIQERYDKAVKEYGETDQRTKWLKSYLDNPGYIKSVLKEPYYASADRKSGAYKEARKRVENILSKNKPTQEQIDSEVSLYEFMEADEFLKRNKSLSAEDAKVYHAAIVDALGDYEVPEQPKNNVSAKPEVKELAKLKETPAKPEPKSAFKVGDVITYQPKGSNKAIQATIEGINADGTLQLGGEYNYMHHSWMNVSPDEVTLPASTDITKAKERYKNNFAAGLQKYLDKGMFTIADANKAIQQREKAIERIEERINAGNPEPADLENFAKCQGEIEALEEAKKKIGTTKKETETPKPKTESNIENLRNQVRKLAEELGTKLPANFDTFDEARLKKVIENGERIKQDRKKLETAKYKVGDKVTDPKGKEYEVTNSFISYEKSGSDEVPVIYYDLKGGKEKPFAQPERNLDTWKEMRGDEQPKAEQPKKETKSGNRVFTDDAYERAKERLKNRHKNRLSINIDPEDLVDLLTMAGYHLEKGVRTFSDFCKKMIEDLGEWCKPYLKQTYQAAKYDEDIAKLNIDRKEWSSEDEVMSFDVLNFGKETKATPVEVAENTIKEHEIKKVAKKVATIKKPKKLESNDVPGRNVTENERLGEEEQPEVERPLNEGVVESNTNNSANNTNGGRRNALLLQKQALTGQNKNNYHEERGVETNVPTTPAQRRDANFDAIILANKLVAEGRQATPEEKKVLAKFTGWGGLGPQLGVIKEGMPRGYVPEEQRRAIERLLEKANGAGLTGKVLEDALLSASSSYYTPAQHIDALWDIAERMGFKGGKILEGSAGIGNILARIPSAMADASEIEAVEIDPSTGNILKLLYPDATTHIDGFEKVKVQPNSVDLAITNVPFVSDFKVSDPVNRDISKTFGNLHDFCIAKNVRSLKEGGIGIFISSNGTLDKSHRLREWATNEGKSDFIGAFRLPNNTFKGTPVTTDIIVIRKRINGVKSPNAIDMLGTKVLRTVSYEKKDETYPTTTRNYDEYAPTSDKNHKKGQNVVKNIPLEVNSYFADHPEMMGGDMFVNAERGETYHPTSTGLFPREGLDLNKAIEKFVSGFKEEEQSALSKTPGAVLERTNAKNGTMSVDKNGNVVIARDGSLVKANVKNEVTGVDGTKYPVAEVVRNYDELRNTVQSLIDFQQNSDNDAELANYIKTANRVYDKFVGKYGNLNNNKRLKFLEDDVTFSSIKAIETKDKDEVSGEVTIGKSDILKKRVLNKFIVPEPKTPKDAVIASIFLNGGINSDYVAEKLGITKEQAEKAILKEGLAYRDPMTAEVVPTFQYLSGNVREKLKNVYSAAGYDKNGKEIDGKEVNHEFDKNAEDLRKVIPMTIPSNSIDFNAGSSWIPTRFYSDFIKDRFGVSTTPILNGNVWKVPDANSSSVLNRSKGVYSDKPGMNGFGYTGLELFNGAMNNRTFDFKVTRTVAGEKETYTDKEAAQRATGVVSEMKDDFKEWLRDRIANDADASAEIEEVYNDKFNAIVPMKIGTEYLPTYYPGANTGYPLYGHQKNAVMKCLLGPTLLSHEAGTGKTFTMVSTAMEMKRLGLAHKPVIVPLKATVGQFEGQARLLYPNARILSIPGGLTPAKRNNLLQQMRYNDWDIVLISDSVLKLIPDSEESRNAFINERIDEIQHLIDQAREAREATNKKGASDSSYNIGLNSAISDLTKQLEEEKSKLGAPKKDSKREAKSKANAKGKAELNIERKVDDIETWDKYGVDALFLDEAHTYKHLGFGTSMTRGIKGIDASVSEQAVSAYLKARDVMRRNNGKNFIMATGTPISNTAGEMYTFLKFMMPKDFLMENDIYYFDDFVRNFGEISIKPEFTTSGKFKAVSRFASYDNVPELMRVWTTICDTVIGTDSPEVREKLPKVINAKGEIKKGEDNPTDIFLKQSPTLIKIMRAIRTTLQEFEDMTPQEKKENSHIPVTMFGKASAAAIDPRLVWKKAKDEPNSKVNAAVKYILEDLKKTESYKGISVVFCEKHSRHDIVRDEFGEPVLDSKGKPKKTVGFNVFEDIKQKLIANGVPESQIAIITGNSMSENVKNEIFEKANRGEVRVVMGSARTVGTGVNIQRLAHLGIHLDVPVKPSDYEQENKRIIRQGNLHTIWDLPVEIVRFGVEDTLDVTGYQMLETKGKFVNSVRHVDKYFENSISDRTIEEEDESSFSHPVAMLSGSEFAAKKQIAEQDYRKFKNRKEQWDRQQIWYTNTLNVAKAKIKDKQKDIDKWNDAKKDLEGIFPNHKIETISINGVDCNTPEKLEETFKNINKELRQFDDEHRNAQGFNKQTLKYEMVVNGTKVDIDVVKERTIGFDPATHQMTGSMSTDITMHIPSINKGYNISGQYIKGAYDLINNELATGAYYDKWIKNAEDAIDESKATIEKFKDLEGKPFPDEDKLSKFEAILEEYQKGMELEMAEKEKKYTEEVGEEDSVTLEELLDSDDDEDEPDVDDEAMFGMEDDVRAIRDDESLIEYAQRLDRMNRSNEQIDAEERNQAINDLVESAQPDADDAVKGATKAAVQGLIDNIGGKDTHIVPNQEDLNALFNRKSEAMSFANSVAEFIKIRNKAVAQKGIVLAGLSNAEIKIVRGGGFGFEGKRPSEWAYENLVTEHDKSGKIKYDNNLPEMADGTRYSISKSAINKYLSGSSFHKGENGEYNVKAHIQLLPILKDVIKNSIDAEIHPDYNKVNETRNPENGYNERRLVHRLYGAANIDGTIYRVKTTMYEFMDRNEMNRPHSYEVTKIELLDNSNNSIPRGNEDSNTTSVTGANLLKNVEKSYDSGRKLLKESEENGYVQGVDSNIQATNTEAMRTKKGELYGFSKGKDVYLGPKGINPETPFHEYGHLWLRALQGGNKALWNHIKSLMEQVPKEISDFVKKNYPNLEGDALYREILSTYFGRKGRAKFEKDAREAINNGKDWKEKSFVADLFHQIRKALETAKKWIAKNILHVKPEDVKNIDDVFDKCYYDFANGFKPDGGSDITTKNFKSFFGDWENDPKNSSKVVDENGKPLAVYHGTEFGGFTEFNGKGHNTFAPDGTMWFTSSKDVAKTFSNTDKLYKSTDKNSNAPMNYEVYLNIRKPLVIDAQGEYWNELPGEFEVFNDKTNESSYFDKYEDALEYVKENGIKENEISTSEIWDTNDFAKYAKEKGYDGLIVKNVRDNSDKVADDYVVFNPEQIKSATENNGMYDSENPNIEAMVMGGSVKTGTDDPLVQLHTLQSRLYNLKDVGALDEFGRELIAFVRTKLTSGTGLRMGSMRINALVKDIVDATTKKQLEKPIREMQMMLGRANMESKLVTTSKFLRTKGRKNNDRGVAVGTNVDADTNNILTAIRTMFNNPLKTIVDKELSDLRNSRNEKMKQAKELAGVEKFDDITGDMRLADPELDKLFNEVEKAREEIKTLEETQANWQTQNIMEELDSVNNAISELDTRLMDKAAKGEAITDEEARMHDTVLPLRKALAEVRSMLNKDIDETTGEGGLAQYEKLAKDKLKEALEIKPPFKRPANLTGTKWETEWRKYDALMAEHVLAQECAIAAQEKISEKLNEVNEQLFDLIEDGKSKWKMRQEAIREYKKNLVYNAVDEVQNKYLDDDPMRFNKDVLSLVKQGNTKEAVDILNKRMGDKWTRFHDLLIAPMYSLDFTLQMMTPNSRLGEGFLYEHFMKSPETGIVAANDRYYKDKKNTNRQIEDKFTELFGKSSEKVIKSWSKVDHEIKIIAASDDRNGRWKTGDERTISLNKDHALYLWAAWRQSDGKAKMQYEGFTDEDMQKIEDYLGEDAIKFGEWVTEELLPTLRDTKYNPTYRKLFGTDMARIDHYFPLSIDKTSIKPQDPKDKEHPKYMASLVVPNVIERTHNILPLDPTVLFTKVLSDYVDSQSHWVNVAPVIQDLNTLMASSTFSNRVESNHKGMMKIFRDAAYTATASAQKVDNSAADKLLLPLLAHAQVAAIAIKPYGALKQILSAPAVLAYSGDAQFYKEIGDLIGAFSPKWFSQAVNKYTPEIIEKHFGTIISPNNILAKYDWCLKNLPAFEERADRGDMGIEGLAYVDTWGKLSKSAKDIAIFMNQRVDLWTVAWMAKAVYDCEMRKNLALGDSQEVAHKKAVICAEIMYNQSQQSTRPEFSSYAQKHGNALEKSYTMFQSGPIGYARKTLSSANEFSHAEDQYKWDVKHGMDEKKAADKKARTQAHAIFTGIVFTAVLNGLWAAGGRPAMFVDPDDDDLKSIISNTVATSIFNGTYLAPMASSMAGGYEYHTFDILNERKKIVDMLKDDKKSGMAVALEVANALIKYNFSVDAKEVIEDIDWLLSESTYESFMIGEHLNADLALGVIRLTRMPKSQQARFAKVLYKQYGATEFAKAVNVIKRKDLNNYWVDSYAKDYVQMNFGKDFLEDMKEYPKYLKRLNSGTLTEDDARFFNFPDAAYKDYDMAMQSLRANIREQNPEGAFFGRKKNIAFGDMYARSIIEKVYKEWQRVNEK